MDLKENLKIDLDGVLRYTIYPFVKKYDLVIDCWYWKYNGMDIYDLTRKNKFRNIKNGKETKYFKVLKPYVEMGCTIWSSQPLEWQLYTEEWLSKKFKNYKINYMDSNMKRELLDRNPNFILIEDYPFFENYKQIILLDKLYNQKTNAPIRIKKPKELKNILTALENTRCQNLEDIETAILI